MKTEYEIVHVFNLVLSLFAIYFSAALLVFINYWRIKNGDRKIRFWFCPSAKAQGKSKLINGVKKNYE